MNEALGSIRGSRQVTGTPQHGAKAELAARSHEEVREGGWAARAEAGVPPRPLIHPTAHDHHCNECIPVSAAMPRALHRTGPR